MTTVKDDIDWLARNGGYGNLSEAVGNALYGINHRGAGNPIPYNTDNHGITFFTRPRLNLSYDNVSMDRVLTPLLTRDPYTYQRAVRVLLDPVGAADPRDPVLSPLVDRRSPFIALLSNNLLSLNGWPDPIAEYYDSKPGPAKESWSMLDGVTKFFGTFDLQASFRSISGDPISLLLESWRRYGLNVYSGLMMPYPDSIIENEKDYETAIYRLTLDPSRRFIQKISRTIAIPPTSSGLGASFNFSSDLPFNQDTAQQLSIPFHCQGVEYNDPILFKEFNDISGFYNHDLLDTRRTSKMTKLRREELIAFNYYGYPRINPLTQELEWWVYNDDYKRLNTSPLSQTPPTTPTGRGYLESLTPDPSSTTGP